MPPVKSRKRARAADPGSGVDRIGALPDEILHRVLSFLPAQQAVRTCVLARRWIHLWKSATGLRIVGPDGKAPVPFEQVREFVDSLLLLRGASPLETFKLKIAGAAVDVRHLRLWVRYAMMCNVQELGLKVHGNVPVSLRPEDPSFASKHLTRLLLRGLVFNNDFLDFSRCPALHALKIEDCSFIHVERISSQSLYQLDIIRGVFNYSYRTRIHTPNLATLELIVDGGRTPILERMPLLVSAAVAIMGSSDCCSRSNNGDCGDERCKGCIRNDSSSVLLHCISQVKTLGLAAGAETFIFRRDLKWCPTFSQLKDLALTEHNVHALSRILEHSPVLESLKLYLLELSKGFKTKVKMSGRFNPTELPSTISPHLKRVKVRCETVDTGVLKVLKFLSNYNISFCFRAKKKKCKAGYKSSTT
ncbi:unnamed protein product [Urochloa humidicola]